MGPLRWTLMLGALLCLVALGMSGPADGLTPPSAGAAARALALPPPMSARVDAYAATWQAVREARDSGDATACRLVTEAQTLAPALFRALNPRVDAAREPARGQLARRIAALDAALPGIDAVSPAGYDVAFGVAIAYGELADAAPEGSPGRALLAAAGGILGSHGLPGHVRVIVHERGCTDYGQILKPLAALAPAWRQGSPSMKAALRKPLREAFDWLGDEVNFCKAEAIARADVRAALPLLMDLVELGGPDAARRLAANMRATDMQFNQWAETAQ